MLNRIALLALAMLLAACGEPPQVTQKRGDARAAMFKECMQLAAAMPRQADDDVSDIVNSCATQSWYMTNHVQ